MPSAAGAEPTAVRRAHGRQDVTVTSNGEVEWIAVFEVPEDRLVWLSPRSAWAAPGRSRAA